MNERRDVAAAKLRAKAEAVVLSLKQTDSINIDPSLDGRLLHYQGQLLADEPPTDHDFGVTNRALLAIRRTVQMYQNVESKRKDKDGKIIYEYSQKWSSSPQPVEGDTDKRNPPFPSDLPGGVFVFLANGIHLGKLDRLLINDDMAEQLTDFKPLALSREYIAQDMEYPHELKPNATRSELTNSKKRTKEVGDLRVAYEGLFTGPYSSVSKLVVVANQNPKDGRQKAMLEPWVGKLKSSLASQGEIRMPENAEQILGIKLETFIIPEKVIEWAESLLLTLAPLHINYLAPGSKSVKAAIQGIAQRDSSTRDKMRLAGGAIIFLGCVTLMPTSLATTGPGLAAAAVASGLLAWESIRTATPQKTGTSPSNAGDTEL